MRYSTNGLKIALIGNGAIARQIAEFCARQSERLEIVGALALEGETSSVGSYPLVWSLEKLMALRPSLIVECAGHSAVACYGEAILGSGTDLILVSVGSLSDYNLLMRMQRAASRGAAQVILPAGALPGVDALAAARLAGLDRVELRSSKPPCAWAGTPAEEVHDLKSIDVSTIIFEGNAREAARLFPKNANVAATAAIAGVGFERTQVVLIADPNTQRNSHRLEAEGGFGRMVLDIQANPSPDNPKSSLMAALSVMRLLEHQDAGIVV